MKGKVLKMTINTIQIKDTLRYANRIFDEMKRAKLRSGDTFDYTRFESRHYDPTTIAAWADLGIVKLKTKQLVKKRRGHETIMTVEEFAEALAKGKNPGSFYTRNVYEVITTDFETYKERYLAKVRWELDNFMQEIENI